METVRQKLNLRHASTAFALLLSLFSGCGPAHPSLTASHPVSYHAPSGGASMQRVYFSVLYIQARQACRAKRYIHASYLLARLAKTPGFTPDEIAFCRAQRTICLKDAGMFQPPASEAMNTKNARPDAHDDADCGPRALLLVCREMGADADLPKLRRAAGTTAKGTSMEGLANAAKCVGLKAEGVQMDREALRELDTPAIAWTNRDHYVAVLSVAKGGGEDAAVTIHDPNDAEERTIPQESLLQMCGGYLLLLRN